METSRQLQQLPNSFVSQLATGWEWGEGEELLMRVAKVAGQKLTWWQYDQTSWSAREWMLFALQRLSVQLWTALAD